MKTNMEELAITPSYNRPRVSNDNPFSESTFRKLKYRPKWPSHGLMICLKRNNGCKVLLIGTITNTVGLSLSHPLNGMRVEME
jgi:hypothetical protein